MEHAPLPAVAAVVAVAVAPAAGCGAEYVVAAGLADDEAAEQVLGVDGRAPGVVLAAFGQEVLGGVEGRAVHELGVRRGVPPAAE